MAYSLTFQPTSSTNPSIFRTDQPTPSDTTTEQVQLRGIASSRRRDIIFVVNPKGANGRTCREWKKLFPFVKSRLGPHTNVRESFTSGPSTAIEITREAIRNGADAVIAVGGDGTLHEVVNGFFCDSKHVHGGKYPTRTATLGLIPLGTGSDFARSLGWKNDPAEAVERITRGESVPVDVGFVDGRSDGRRQYFINVADVHLSAKAGYYAVRYKCFGRMCYILGALHAFGSHRNRDLRIKVDNGEWEVCHHVTALCVGNAKYFGGGMKITPTADPLNGHLQVVLLKDFKWNDFIWRLHKLYTGTHLSQPNVISYRAYNCMEVEEFMGGGDGGVYVQADGEHVGFLPATFGIKPSALHMFL